MRVLYTTLAFLVTALLARILGAANLGVYYEAVSWALLLSGLIQAGWAPFLVREIASLKARDCSPQAVSLARSALRVIVVLGVVGTGLLGGVAWLSIATVSYRPLYLLAAPTILFVAVATVLQAVIRGAGYPLLGQVSENIVRPSTQFLGLFMLWAGFLSAADATLAAMAFFLVGTVAGAVAAWSLARKTDSFGWRMSTNTAPLRSSKWLPSLLQNSMIGWVTAVNLQAGTLITASLASSTEVANFRIAMQLSMLLSFGLIAVNQIYARDFSRQFALGDLEGMRQLALRTCRFSLATALPWAAFFLIAGPFLISKVFGAEFQGAYAPLVLLTFGQVANALFGSVATIAIATRSERAVLLAQAAGAAITIFGSFALVFHLGAIGAAAANAASLVIWNILLFLFLKRTFGIRSFVGLRH